MSSTEGRPQLQFLGGAGTVTGSKYLITHRRQSMLLECGLFQGLKKLRLRNWKAPPFRAAALRAVVVSHAHIDHTGYLPRLVREGFDGPIYCTHGTAELLEVLLPDAGRIQEEDAEYANRKGFSKHRPALPLFDERDARRTLRLLEKIRYDRPAEVTSWCRLLFRPAGHIFGSATVELQFDSQPPGRLLFSGDLGRWGRPIIKDPERVDGDTLYDLLLLESTYGDRVHPPDRADDELADAVNTTVKRHGVLVIPAFAVGRTQEVLWRLDRLMDGGRIDSIPVYIDSPMAVDVTDIYRRHPEEHDLDMRLLVQEGGRPLSRGNFTFVADRNASIAINDRSGPMIIIAGSGMATGGRVLHHLKHRVGDPANMVLLVGYQAEGTRGRSLQDGAPRIKLHGRWIPVRAEVRTLEGLSAHADRHDIDRWLDALRHPPRRTFLVHGEPHASEALRDHLVAQRGWPVEIARPDQRIILDGQTATGAERSGPIDPPAEPR